MLAKPIKGSDHSSFHFVSNPRITEFPSLFRIYENSGLNPVITEFQSSDYRVPVAIQGLQSFHLLFCILSVSNSDLEFWAAADTAPMVLSLRQDGSKNHYPLPKLG